MVWKEEDDSKERPGDCQESPFGRGPGQYVTKGADNSDNRLIDLLHNHLGRITHMAPLCPNLLYSRFYEAERDSSDTIVDGVPSHEISGLDAPR